MQKLMQMNWSEAQSQLNHVRSFFEGSWFEVFMLDRPTLILVTVKVVFWVGDILTWGRFDGNPLAINQVRPWRLDCRHTTR